MAKFDFFNRLGTQKLYKKAAQKIVKRYGIPIYYVQKSEKTEVDNIYGEQYGSRMVFDKAFPMKMYLENFENYDGALAFNSFLSVLDNSMRFCIDVETFRKVVGLPFPEEGDIVFIALKGLKEMETPKHFRALEGFEIKHCERRKDFYELNFFNLVTLECSRLEYNHQIFKTGVEMIDSLNEIDKIDMGDNSAIDEIDRDGLEIFNPETGVVEQSTLPVTEESPCNPKAQQPNHTAAQDWKAFTEDDPYGGL